MTAGRLLAGEHDPGGPLRAAAWSTIARRRRRAQRPRQLLHGAVEHQLVARAALLAAEQFGAVERDPGHVGEHLGAAQVLVAERGRRQREDAEHPAVRRLDRDRRAGPRRRTTPR